MPYYERNDKFLNDYTQQVQDVLLVNSSTQLTHALKVLSWKFHIKTIFYFYFKLKYINCKGKYLLYSYKMQG